jgi:nicotinamidase-related amidase
MRGLYAGYGAAVSVALIVVDMQEYFCSLEFPLGRLITVAAPEEARWYAEQLETTVVPNIARLLDEFRAQGRTVVFTEFGSRTPDGSDLPVWARRHNDTAVALVGEHCYPPLTDPSARVISAFTPHTGEAVVTKTTSGPLAGTDIADQLRVGGIDRVVVTGVATHVCVAGMARELADADFDAYVVTDACSTPSRAAHAAALESLGGTFATLVDTQGVLTDLV